VGLQVTALTTVGAVAAELGLSLPPNVTTWVAGATYALNALVEPTRPNGRYYKATVAGVAGATQPSWPFAAGGTVVDGGVTWTDQGASQQGQLERMINASGDAFERYCSRKFIYGQWTENLTGSGRNRLVVTRPPLYSIVSISFEDATIDPVEYEIEGQIGSEPSLTGFIYRQIGWVWTANYVLSAEPYRLPGSEYDLYQVVYNGGWQTPQFDGQAGQNGAPAIAANLPGDLEQAAISHVVSMWRRRQWDRNNASEGADKYSQERYQNAEMIPAELLPTLNRYRQLA
jgi:hypothetical protein